MVVEYDRNSRHFRILFQMHGSALPKSVPRSIPPVCVSIVVAIISGVWNFHFPPGLSSMYQGTGLLIGLIMSFRLSHSYGKWSAGVQSMTKLANTARTLVTMTCGFIPDATEEVQAQIISFRRDVVLMCMLMMKHMREDRSLKDVHEKGILTDDKLDIFEQRVFTKAYNAAPEAPADFFPHKARLALVSQMCREANTRWLYNGQFKAPHMWNQLDKEINELMSVFEDIEFLQFSQLPFPYAQYIQWNVFIYSMLFPLGVVSLLGVLTPLATFFISVVFYTIDEIAVELEDPFGLDSNDLDLERRIRRIDKETASLVGAKFGLEISNFDLFPLKASEQGEGFNDYQRGSTSQLKTTVMSRIDGLANCADVGGRKSSRLFRQDTMHKIPPPTKPMRKKRDSFINTSRALARQWSRDSSKPRGSNGDFNWKADSFKQGTPTRLSTPGSPPDDGSFSSASTVERI